MPTCGLPHTSSKSHCPHCQLLSDLEKWTAPVAEAFALLSRTLPPWRRKDVLVRMYEAVANCDAAPSYTRLRSINLQIAEGAAGPCSQTLPSPSRLEGPHLDSLRGILGSRAGVDPTLLHLSEPEPDSPVALGAYFDTEVPDGHAPEPARSGLSLLLDGVRGARSHCGWLQEPAEPSFASHRPAALARPTSANSAIGNDDRIEGDAAWLGQVFQRITEGWDQWRRRRCLRDR